MSVESKWLGASAALASGEVLGRMSADVAGSLWPVAAGAALFAAVAGCLARKTAWLFAVLLFAGLALSLRFGRSVAELERDIAVHSMSMPYRTVLEVRSDARRSATGREGRDWFSFPSSIGGIDVQVLFLSADGDLPRMGERWECAGYLSRPAKDGRRRKFWIKGPDAFARRAPDSAGTRFSRFLRKVRNAASERLATGKGCDALSVSLLRAVLLGERGGVPSSSKSYFSAAGTMHIFAVSGLHVALIAGFIRVFLSLLCVPYRAAVFLTVPLLWLYTAMIGWTPPTVRAASMISIAELGLLFFRRPCAIPAWSATFIAVYALSPGLLGSIGAMLSFVVMLAIILWKDYIDGAVVPEKWSFLGFSFVAWIAGVPVIAYAFGRISVGALLANLVAIPLVSIALVSSVSGLILGLVSTTVEGWCNNLASLAMKLTDALSAFVAAIPGASLQVGRCGAVECVLWYALFFLSAFLVRSIILRKKSIL